MGSLRTRISLSVAGVALACCGGAPESSSSGTKIDAPGAPPPAPAPWVAPQRSGCTAGQAPDGSGGCVAAGVAQCAPGFEREGADSCRAILPAAACAAGTMAVPGETTCRLVAPCGNGTWGDVPTAATTQYVDASYVGGGNDGTSAKPWTKIMDAYVAAAAGATIAVAAGRYEETVDISGKAVVLAGRCPSMVEIHGLNANGAAVLVRGDVDGAIVRGVALTGVGAGVMISAAKNILVESVWAHDLASYPVSTADAWGPANVTFRNVLVEDYAEVTGVAVLGVPAVLESSVIRNAKPKLGAVRGMGADVETLDPRRGVGKLTIRSSVIENVVGSGFLISGASAEIDATVIRDTQSDLDGAHGRGVEVQSGEGMPRASLVVRRSVFERNRDVSILDVASDLEVSDTVVRDSLVAPKGLSGRGLQAQVEAGKKDRPRLVLTRSVFQNNREAGVLVLSGQATIESVVIRDTRPRAQDNTSGVGLAVEYEYRPGMNFADAVPSDVDFRWSRVERSTQLGVVAMGSELRMEGVLVDDTRAQSADLAFGDGVVVFGGPVAAKLSMTGSRIARSARAAVANFAGHADIAQSDLLCNGLDLDGESLGGTDFAYSDRGANACGCAPTPTFCRVLTARLEPPALQ